MITGKIKSISKRDDVHKNISVFVEFREDGVLIPGFENWEYIARWENFAGKTAEEIDYFLSANIKYQIGNIIKSMAINTINTDLTEKVLTSFIDRSYSADSVTFNTTPEIAITVAPDGVITRE